MDNEETSRDLIVVPRRPGPLIELPSESPRDEIDDVLDDLFGEPPDESPGALDAVLALGGGTLVVVALLTELPTWVLAVGAAGLALGVTLPLHHLWRLSARARSLRRVRTVLGQGTPLNVGSAETRRLVAAYRRIERMVEGEFFADAFELAHLALLEVADLLRGRPPHSPAELRYVAERTKAISDLAGHLRPPAVEPQAPIDEDAVRDSAVQAVRDLEDRTGSGSLNRMEQLNRLLETRKRPDDLA